MLDNIWHDNQQGEKSLLLGKTEPVKYLGEMHHAGDSLFGKA